MYRPDPADTEEPCQTDAVSKLQCLLSNVLYVIRRPDGVPHPKQILGTLSTRITEWQRETFANAPGQTIGAGSRSSDTQMGGGRRPRVDKEVILVGDGEVDTLVKFFDAFLYIIPLTLEAAYNRIDILSGFVEAKYTQLKRSLPPNGIEYEDVFNCRCGIHFPPPSCDGDLIVKYKCLVSDIKCAVYKMVKGEIHPFSLVREIRKKISEMEHDERPDADHLAADSTENERLKLEYLDRDLNRILDVIPRDSKQVMDRIVSILRFIQLALATWPNERESGMNFDIEDCTAHSHSDDELSSFNCVRSAVRRSIPRLLSTSDDRIHPVTFLHAMHRRLSEFKETLSQPSDSSVRSSEWIINDDTQKEHTAACKKKANAHAREIASVYEEWERTVRRKKCVEGVQSNRLPSGKAAQKLPKNRR